MSPAELRAKCEEQVRAAGPGTVVTLFLRGRKSKSGTARLLGRFGGPTGDVYSDTDGGLVVGFKASDLLAYLDSLPPEQPRNGGAHK